MNGYDDEVQIEMPDSRGYARQIDEEYEDNEEASTAIKDVNNDSLIGSQASRHARL